MTKIALFYLLILSIFLSCSKSNNIGVFDCNASIDFSDLKMMKELTTNNTEYTFCLIESLRDSTISDCEFANRIAAISNHLHFLFCNIDCNDSEWLSLSKERRDTIRQVVTYGYLEYRSSALFMSKIDNVNCEIGNLYQFCRSEILFNKTMQNEFRVEIDQIQNACK